MLESSDIPYIKPSNFNNKSNILGIGKDFLLILLFSSLKSEMKRTVPFFWGIIKVGMFTFQYTCVDFSLYILGIGSSLACFGLASS